MRTSFRPIPGYNFQYKINEQGEVRSFNRDSIDSCGRQIRIHEQIIVMRIDRRTGYPVVKLSKSDGRFGTQYLHRLIAKTFISNPFNKKFVNHKNGNKLDFSTSNLEWVTKAENQQHAIRRGLDKIPSENKTPVINSCTGKLYSSIKEAAVDSDLSYHQCKLIISGRIFNSTCLKKVA